MHTAQTAFVDVSHAAVMNRICGVFSPIDRMQTATSKLLEELTSLARHTRQHNGHRLCTDLPDKATRQTDCLGSPCNSHLLATVYGRGSRSQSAVQSANRKLIRRHSARVPLKALRPGARAQS
eukprot:164753-Pleurochrysis_carterae.AAC.1